MEEFLAIGASPCGQQIYMSELSAKTLIENGIEDRVGGLYLYEASDSPNALGIRVLASVPCLDAGFRMMDILGLRMAAE